MGIKGVWSYFRECVSEFFEDDALTLAAALAFYTALSISPLLLILVWSVSLISPGTQAALVDQLVTMVGPEAGQIFNTIVANAQSRPSLITVAGIFSIATVLLGATGVFGQLQHSLNLIWDVRAKPNQGVWLWARKRFMSAGMVFTLAFLMMVSLVISAALSAVMGRMQHLVPGSELVWQGLHFGVSVFVFALLFAVLFRYLPDVKIRWSNVWFGAILTALLFAIGKFAIGFYLGQSAVASAFGATGSVILFLVWVYYSAAILFFGAEITQVRARRTGQAIEPNDHAVRVERICREQPSPPRKSRLQPA